jgi:hypothetical protein
VPAPAIPSRRIVNLNDSHLLNSPDMPAAIREFCSETKQPDPGIRRRSNSLLFSKPYVKISRDARRVRRIHWRNNRVIHGVRGSFQNQRLNQFADGACQRPAITDPV